MSTIQDKLTYLNDTKQHLKAAIESKGVTVPADTPFRGYAALVESISGGGGENVTVTGYVVGTPVEFTIPAADWSGTNYTIKADGYKIGDNGLQLGLPVDDDTVNTQAVITAALTIPNATYTAATDSYAAYVTIDISAVNTPTRDITIAVFGLEVA